MSKIKTINLQGNETKVTLDTQYAYIECMNMSESEVLMSAKPNIKRGNDDVIIIKAEASAKIGDIGDSRLQTVYLIGNGEVQIIGKNFPQNSFKSLQKGGDPSVRVMPQQGLISAYYDYQNVQDNIWKDSLNNAPLSAEFNKNADGSVTPSRIVMLPFDLTKSFTIYAIVKEFSSTSGWVGIIEASNPTPQFNLAMYNNLLSIGSGTSTGAYTSNVNLLNGYAIVTITYYEGLGRLYINGKLVNGYNGYSGAFTAKYGIQPTAGFKALAVFENIAQTDSFIAENVKYLADKYDIAI